MLIKLLKLTVVFLVMTAFFSGAAMAGDRGRDNHHTAKWDPSFRNHRYDKGHNHYYHHRDYGRPHYQARHHNPPAPVRHQPEYRVSASHPLAPRIVFVGPIPVPVPPPPHEVIGFLTGHR